MHYYNWNISDYSSHTSHLTEMEDLAYRRMLDWLYLHEIPLPKQVKEIARVIRMREHCECIANVLLEFFTEHSDGYTHKRFEKELDAYRAKSERAKKSAQARWSKNKGLTDANALQSDCERNAKQETINNNHKTDIKVANAPPVDKWLEGKPDTKSFKQCLRKLQCKEETIIHFLEVRKKKKAVNSKRSLEKIISESKKAGFPVSKAIEIAADKNWAGFEAEWIKPKQTKLEREEARANDIYDITNTTGF